MDTSKRVVGSAALASAAFVAMCLAGKYSSFKTARSAAPVAGVVLFVMLISATN